MNIILQRFANREYRLTHQDVIGGKPNRGDKHTEKQAEKFAIAVRDTYVLQQELQQGESASISDGRLERRSFGEVDARLGLRALDIINEFHLVQKVVQKGGWGYLSKPTQFTRNARHRLLEAGAIVDKFCGLNAYEITCTLPGSTSDSMRLLAENTGWIMNELTRVIRKAKCKYWFYVWELQKRGALHLHLLVASPEKNMESLAETLQSRWWVLLKSISAKEGRDAFARRTGGTWSKSPFRWQSHIAPIRKSVAAYFSKYAGKGSSTSSKSSTHNRAFCPSRWWGCSTEIKAQIKAHRQKYILNTSTATSHRIKEYLESWLRDPGLLKSYQYEFQLGKTTLGRDIGGGKVQINYYTDDAFARLQSWESIMWDAVLAIAHEAGEYDYPTQTWTNADMACRHVLYADMDKRRHDTSNADMSKHTPPPPPLSQQSSSRRKLSKSRGTQAKPTLDLRACLVQFLTGGGGGDPTRILDNKPHQPLLERVTEYIQGELFC